MARARNIKPGFFRNAELVELPVETRLLFIGLWTLADRSGRLEDRPKQIKMELFPADGFDCEGMLAALAGIGAIERYEVAGKRFIQVVNFQKHQNPHRDEKASTIPNSSGELEPQHEKQKKNGANTVPAPCDDDAGTVAIGLIPDSRFPSSVPNGTDAAVAPSSGGKPEDQEKRELFDAGKSLLAEQGMNAKQTGSFIGKLAKDYGQPAALEAVRSAVVNRPLGAAEYLKATCQRLKGERRDPVTVPSDAAERTAEYLAAKAAHTPEPQRPEVMERLNAARLSATLHGLPLKVAAA